MKPTIPISLISPRLSTLKDSKPVKIFHFDISGSNPVDSVQLDKRDPNYANRFFCAFHNSVRDKKCENEGWSKVDHCGSLVGPVNRAVRIMDCIKRMTELCKSRNTKPGC